VSGRLICQLKWGNFIGTNWAPLVSRGSSSGLRVPLSVGSNRVSSGIVIVVQLVLNQLLTALFTCKQQPGFWCSLLSKLSKRAHLAAARRIIEVGDDDAIIIFRINRCRSVQEKYVIQLK
jgi:hypothetical protein